MDPQGGEHIGRASQPPPGTPITFTQQAAFTAVEPELPTFGAAELVRVLANIAVVFACMGLGFELGEGAGPGLTPVALFTAAAMFLAPAAIPALRQQPAATIWAWCAVAIYAAVLAPLAASSSQAHGTLTAGAVTLIVVMLAACAGALRAPDLTAWFSPAIRILVLMAFLGVLTPLGKVSGYYTAQAAVAAACIAINFAAASHRGTLLTSNFIWIFLLFCSITQIG